MGGHGAVWVVCCVYVVGGAMMVHRCIMCGGVLTAAYAPGVAGGGPEVAAEPLAVLDVHASMRTVLVPARGVGDPRGLSTGNLSQVGSRGCCTATPAVQLLRTATHPALPHSQMAAAAAAFPVLSVSSPYALPLVPAPPSPPLPCPQPALPTGPDGCSHGLLPATSTSPRASTSAGSTHGR